MKFYFGTQIREILMILIISLICVAKNSKATFYYVCKKKYI